MPDARTNPADCPIGVFDSGVGGLSVLREIRAALPNEDLLYVADCAHAPYGPRPREYVRERALVLARFLTAQGAKALVIASNTTTAAAAEAVRAAHDMPVVAMEPAVKPAAASTRSGVIGILATAGTLESARFEALLGSFADGVEVVTQRGTGLVERVEAGDLNGPETRALVERHTSVLVEAGADAIVLGSTHYHFLREAVVDAAGPGVQLIDTSAAVARRVRDVLDAAGLLQPSSRAGTEHIWTSGDERGTGEVMARLWGRNLDVLRLPGAVA
jgi:glutamate racemase